MISIVDIYEVMHEADRQCRIWKSKYNELSDDITSRERAIAITQGVVDEEKIFIRIKKAEENNIRLQSYGARYNFWKGEVHRLADLLKAERAYQEMLKEVEK